MNLRAALVLALLGSGCLHFHNGPMPGEPKDATYLQVEGTRVRYVDVGEGPAVVLLHGFASSIENWVTVMPQLVKDHRIIAIDMRGFGWTDRPVADYSPASQAKLLKAVLDERKVGKISLVAHSYGSSVALAFALDYPEQVERIALYDAWVYDEQLPSMFHMARAKGVGEVLFGLFYSERADERLTLGFYDPDMVTQHLADEVEKAFARPGTRAGALEAVRGMRFEELEPRYKTITVPTLLLWGREDLVTPVSVGEKLVRQLPNAQLKVYPRCGHFPMIEAISASNRDLAAFLGGAP
ncbi:MAG: alpha/beta hydrolase [Archangium sp.]|nr:alpha/beta hydrolase [Archangium sp.]MDP3576348.1 alpha/beta hydrolase [Archangium sp.]